LGNSPPAIIAACDTTRPMEDDDGQGDQGDHDLRHQELRHDEEGAGLAGQAPRRLFFHDYKTEGIERARLEQWCKEVGWETLLNRAGTTFRKLPESEKANVDARKALRLMLAQPSMIKRPVLELGGGKLVVGFAPENYRATLAAAK
jgi:arsenate reductase (glutaredoxin)